MKLKWIILILLVVAASWVYISDKTSKDPAFIDSAIANGHHGPPLYRFSRGVVQVFGSR